MFHSNADVQLVLRYCVIGGLNSLFGFTIIVLSMFVFGLAPMTSNVIGYFAGYLLGYSLHRQFTFRSSVSYGQGWVAYLSIVSVGYAVNAAVLMTLVYSGLNNYVSQAVAVGAYVVLTFSGCKWYVFKGNK